MVQTGHMMKGGTIVDATIINAPSSTKNAGKARDPEKYLTKKENEWKFGMKCHIGVDADSGLVHTMTVTGDASLRQKGEGWPRRSKLSKISDE